MEKPGTEGGWLQEIVGWLPRKFGELRTFFTEVRSELKSVTWPARQEIYSTTIVVVLTSVFFGFYLYGLDLILSELLARVVKQ